MWVTSNLLTLGEFNILFGMLDKETQSNIVSNFYDLDTQQITIKKISSFSGILETIRIMRNIVNHYEPIYPFIYKNISRAKKMETTHLKKVFDLLFYTFHTSYFTNISKIEIINIPETLFNHNHLKTLNFINNIVSRT